VSLANGAISGVNLGEVAKLLQSTARVLGGALGDSSRTDFSALSSSFTIRNGVVQTGDLQMSSPTINMTGAGTVDLASRQVNFHIVPKAQLGVAGVNLLDIGIPFYVRGSIDNPSFEPDPAGIAKGVVGSVAGTATGVVNTVGDTATKALSVPGNAIKSLFGN
jgi:AsmA protein